MDNPDRERMGRNEVAGYQVSLALGFEDLIAPTVLRATLYPGTDRVVNFATQLTWHRVEEGNEGNLDRLSDDDVWAAAVLDVAIAEGDRKGHNWLLDITPAGVRLRLIDQGHAFGYGGFQSTFYERKEGERIPDQILKKMDRGWASLPRRLEKLLPPDALEGTINRVKQLLEGRVLAL